MKNLKYYSSAEIASLTNIRKGETKIGEQITALQSIEELPNSEALFVILAIKEDIGIRANYGKAGAATCIDYVLPALLNVQENRFLSAKQFCLLGYLEFADYMSQAEGLDPNKDNDLDKLRELTALIDLRVAALIQVVIENGKVPIVIGGGHNNSYGIIKGCAAAKEKNIDVLNIDPHADFRALEGRHSGNGFSYAQNEALLGRYAVFGLHESYNNQATLETFRSSAELYYMSFDELLTFSTAERDRLFKDALRWLGSGQIGLELDLDSITRMPVSAYNGSGYSMRQARLLVKTAAALSRPYYFHLAEGAPSLADSEQERELMGKAITYLITDFIKSYGE
jgi:formiminoglutamase